jgi:hypothetical protein
MRILIAAALVGTALAATPVSQSRQDSGASDSLERGFVANGRVSMDLSAGEYRISASPGNRIRLVWSVRDASRLSRVTARADVRGPEAIVSIDGPRNSNLRVGIEVPSRADLSVRLTAGELRIERIEGNKDITLHAGELDIDVGKADDYRRVEASVWAGELHASPFGATKEGLFRSLDWKGKGPYSLSAHLKAGELHLHTTRTVSRAD